MIANAWINEAHKLLLEKPEDDEARERFQKLVQCLDDFLDEDIRIADVAMYLEAQVKDKYAAIGRGPNGTYDPAKPEHVQRVYGLDQYKTQQPLSGYELKSSKVLVTYVDGTRECISPKKIDNKWALPHKLGSDNKPYLDLTFHGPVQNIQLLNYLEDHTKTMLFRKKRPPHVQESDIFYNHLDERPGEPEHNSPHLLGAGEVNLKDVQETGMHAAGTVLVGADGERVSGAQVWQESVPYIHEIDKARASLGTTGDDVRAVGIPLRTSDADLKVDLEQLTVAAEKLATQWTPPVRPDLAAAIRKMRAE
jgi:hypothetical protein